jgi:hypothetical protein
VPFAPLTRVVLQTRPRARGLRAQCCAYYNREPSSMQLDSVEGQTRTLDMRVMSALPPIATEHRTLN